MLATLSFWPLLGLPLTYAAATINVISASDDSLVYSPGWSQEFSQSTQDSFKQTAGIFCSLSVTLPINASSVAYVGFKRAGGSMYGYNLDCEGDCTIQTANGSDPTVTDDTSVPPSTLFTLDLDPSTQHTLYVYNIPSDASDGSSQINLNNLNVVLASDVTTGAGGGPPVRTTDDPVSISSTTFSAGSSTSEQASASTTPASPSSSASATSSRSNSVSTTPTNVGVSSSSATQVGDSSSSATQTDSTGTGSSGSTGSAVLPVTSSSSTAAASSSSGKTSGLSKPVAIGVSVLAVVFGGAIIAALFVFIRQRRQKHRNSYPGSSSGSQPPLSPTGSIIPIMPPPQMRAASATYSPAIPNPFIDPPSPPLDIPFNSSLMQRRLEGRTSPGSPASPAPTIPLPDIPRGADSRSDSPATVYARSDLWITRSPAKPAFAVL